MATCFRWMSVVLGLALFVPLFGQEPKKDSKDGDSDAPAKPKLVSAGKGVSTIIKVDSTSITFKVAYKQPAVENNQLVYKEISQDVTLQFADDIKIRTPEPPEAFDEKGNFKKYTPKELEELKGPDKTLPGYTATWQELRPGQVVEIRLGRRPGTPATPLVKGPTTYRSPYSRPSPRPKSRDDATGEGDKESPDNRPLVTMIVVLREPEQK